MATIRVWKGHISETALRKAFQDLKRFKLSVLATEQKTTLRLKLIFCKGSRRHKIKKNEVKSSESIVSKGFEIDECV
jgi:ribosomal protein S21